uniref:Titin n=1 Tax=Paramormyrops kingsleyae TaxID=1676925 RepID=A0A3B3QDI9_9TELE
MIVFWDHPKNNGGSNIFNYIIERRDRTSLQWVRCNKKDVTDVNFKVTGLLVGHEYEFRISAENAAGLSVPSPSSPFYKASDTIFKPGAPGNPRILDTTKSSITLAWNKPVYDGGSDILGYIVETSLPDEDEWTVVTPKDGLKGTSFTIINLKENQEYKINISGFNCEGVGEVASVPELTKAEDKLIHPEISLDAEFRKVINIRACNTLRLFVPIRGRPDPTVKWSRENDEPIGRATIESTSSFTSVIIENVNRFDSGKYILTVENSAGSQTAFVNVRVLDTPGAPQNLKIIAVTKESVSLTWEPPLNDGGTKIKNYVIEKRESTRKAYATVNANCHKTRWTVDQLQEGCNYYFRVIAENEYGIGLPVETTESVKVSEKPLPPGKIILQDVTKNSVTLTWEKPEHDGGSRIVAYVIEMQSKGNDTWMQSMIVKVPEAVVTGLTQGQEYMFRVSARNEKGTSEPRQIGVPVIIKELVIVPAVKLLFSTFSVLAGEDLTVNIPYAARPKATVSWQKDGTPLKQTSRVKFETTSDQLCLVVKEACRDDVGQYSIKLSNNAGETTADIAIVVLDKPGPPRGPVQVDEVTSDSVTFSWKPPEYDGGCTIKNYIVEKRETSTMIVFKDTITADGGQYTLLLTNLAGTKTISYNVKVLDRPAQCEGPLNITGVTAEKCVLSWHPPQYDGGSSVTHYIIERRETSRLAWTVVTNNCTVNMFKVTKLLEGNEYIFRVMAVNRYGISEPLDSAQVIMKNPFVTPGSPHILEVSNITRDSMTVCWAPPDTDGGSEIIGYIIEKKDRSGIRWTRCNRQKVTDVCFRVTCLAEDHEYEFKVSAENAAGLGEPSLPSAYYKAYDPKFKPGPPTHVHVIDTTKSSISITWGKPVHDGGSAIQGYIVEICKAENEEWIMCTPPTGLRVNKFEIHKLIENQEYNIRVCAMNKIGVGELAAIPGTAKPEEKTEGPELSLDSELRKGIVVRAGGSVRINIPFRGRPSPDIGWSKDEAELSDKVLIEKGLNYTQLSIDGCDRNDTGKYTLKLENKSVELKNAVKASEIPLPVGKVTLIDVTKSSVSLAWEKPEHDGGSRITGYLIEMQPKGTDKWGVTTSTKTCDGIVSALTAGQEYSFRVIAYNEKGKSDPTPLAAPVIANDLNIEPSFRLLFNSYNVKSGKDLKIEIPVIGRPKPKIEWMKDGEALKQTTRVTYSIQPKFAKIIFSTGVFKYCMLMLQVTGVPIPLLWHWVKFEDIELKFTSKWIAFI